MLFLLSRGYDADGFREMVVRAPSETEARKFTACLIRDCYLDSDWAVWLDCEATSCEPIEQNGDTALICSDFLRQDY